MAQSYVRVGGQWRPVVAKWAKVGDEWRLVQNTWVRENGQWRLAHQNELEVVISADTEDANLRSLFEAEHGQPDELTRARFIIEEGVTITASSASNPALRSGEWPFGVEPIVVNHARILGRGGNAGSAGSRNSESGGENGQNGGPGFQAEAVLHLDNRGLIAGGGGGGGGGGSAAAYTVVGLFDIRGGRAGGSGGGGGRPFGLGGEGVLAPDFEDLVSRQTTRHGLDGNDASLEDEGLGGEGQTASRNGATAISGGSGHGGDLGESGQSAPGGQASGGSWSDFTSPGGSGGQAGPAIVGDSFIIYENEGDLRGPRNP